MPLPILAGIAIAFAGGLVASVPAALTGIAVAAVVAKKVGDGVRTSRAQQVQDRVQGAWDVQFVEASRGNTVPDLAVIPEVVANESGFFVPTEMGFFVQHGKRISVKKKDGTEVSLLLTEEERAWFGSEDSSITFEGSPRVRAIVEDQPRRYELLERLLEKVP